MKKVVIAMDSFKGCLSSEEAEHAAKEGVKSICPDCQVVCFPMSDGGEGILDILIKTMKGSYRTVTAHDPLLRPMQVSYGVSGDGCMAIIEMAAVNGLPLLAAEERNPLKTTSFGMGELIRDALEQGCRNFMVGIGGSATNDAGMGMLQALGARFYTKEGKMLEQLNGAVLSRVATIDASCLHPALKEAHFTVACDVNNPFCGLQGATYVYARQKGANDEMIVLLEQGMQSLSEVIWNTTGKAITDCPGAGAAGGMGGGFLAFFDAELKSGIRLLLDVSDFGKEIKGADLIITGEGRVDRQSLMGKVPSGVLEEAQKQDVPVVVVAGSVKESEEIRRAGFQGLFSINSGFLSLEEAMKPERAKENIKNTVIRIMKVMLAFH